MATTTEAVSFRSVATRHPIGRLVRSYRHATATTDFAIADDAVKFFHQAMNSKIVWCRLVVTDIDTNATPTITITADLTDGTTTKTYITTSTVGQTGGLAQPSSAAECANLGYIVPNDNMYWQVKVVTGSATAANGSVYLEVESLMATEYGEVTP